MRGQGTELVVSRSGAAPSFSSGINMKTSLGYVTPFTENCLSTFTLVVSLCRFSTACAILSLSLSLCITLALSLPFCPNMAPGVGLPACQTTESLMRHLWGREPGITGHLIQTGHGQVSGLSSAVTSSRDRHVRHRGRR